MLGRTPRLFMYPPTIHSTHLTRVIPIETLVTLVLPSVPCQVDTVAKAEGDPRWYLCLEPWYQLYCPRFWELIEAEERHSEAVLSILPEREKQLEEANVVTYELLRMGQDQTVLRDEMSLRWTAIYALHIMRQTFLRHHHSQDALPRDDDEIVRIESIQLDIDFPPPQDEPHSIWPCSAPHPTDKPCSCIVVTPASPPADIARISLPPAHLGVLTSLPAVPIDTFPPSPPRISAAAAKRLILLEGPGFTILKGKVE